MISAWNISNQFNKHIKEATDTKGIIKLMSWNKTERSHIIVVVANKKFRQRCCGHLETL